jgi:hypothetical protein
MAKKPTQEKIEASEDEIVNISDIIKKKAPFNNLKIWIIGTTPLITHAWSLKAKKEMLDKQIGVTKTGRAKRVPEQDYNDSLYEFKVSGSDKSLYGFPAMGIKNAILSSAHKDKGIARSTVLQSLWINAPIVRTKPALPGAICDMPLLRIYGDEPEMREDMVKIGSGLNKVASLAYRGQFKRWGMQLSFIYNPVTLPTQALAFLIMEAGLCIGLGEWRNEKKGIFGAFKVADADEEAAWNAFAAGKGAIPDSTEGFEGTGIAA